VPQFFSLTLLWNNIGAFAGGAVVTLELGGSALLVSFVCGFVGWLCRTSRNTKLAWLGFSYVELFRNTPTLVYLYLFYFGLPAMGVRLGAFVYAMLALGIQGGAYVAEIIRGAFAAIEKEQRDAARALGFRPWQSLLLIELPQMISIAFPSLGNQVISIVLGTALASVIAVPELTYQLQIIGDSTYQYFSVFSMDAIGYLILVQLLNQGFQTADRIWFSKWRTYR
jgi:His/Glu/Gln/Arg/opine family amino acid ABC transporter permease subunit